MVLGKLGEQVVPRTEEAFERLHFLEAVPVDREVYYPKKLARDTAAREKFRKERSAGAVEDEVYVMDIVRGRWQNGDSRLQRIVLG